MRYRRTFSKTAIPLIRPSFFVVRGLCTGRFAKSLASLSERAHGLRTVDLLHEQELRAEARLRRGNPSLRYLCSPLIVFPAMARPPHSMGDVRDQLPACEMVLDIIGDLFTHGRQLKHLVFDGRIVSDAKDLSAKSSHRWRCSPIRPAHLRCVRATITLSTATRPGPRWPNTPTGSSAWSAPTRTPNRSRASRSS